MTIRPEPDRERSLLEAVALAADRLLGASDQPRLPEVLLVLGEAAAASRMALVAARDDGSGQPPRMEVRHQWTAPGVARLQPATTGWPPYPERWHAELAAGTTITGPSRAFPPDERAVVEATGCGSIMLVPIVAGDRWYGHLEVGDTADDRTWTPREVDALRAAAGIVGNGIAHRQALAALERRSAILAAVGEATSLLLEADNWRTVLPRVLDSLRTATRARSAWVFGPDASQPGRRATLIYEVLAPGARPTGGHARILELTPEAAALLAQGHPVHDRLPVPERDPLGEALMLRGVASWIMVPMDLGAAAIGVVGLDSDLPRQWVEGEIEGLHILAGALRAAIRRGGTLVSVPIAPSPWGATGSTSLPPAGMPAGVGDVVDAEVEAQALAVELPRPGSGTGNPG
jgi:GAF domain-containing protein